MPKLVIVPFVSPAPHVLTEFADKYELTMVVRERAPAYWEAASRFFAHFDNVNVKMGVLLSSTSGNGSTIQEAIDDYARKIASTRLVLYADGDNRQEFDAADAWSDTAYDMAEATIKGEFKE